ARPRRLFAAAGAALNAGRPGEALALLAEPLAQEDPQLRAAALRLQGRIEYFSGRPKQAAGVLVEASKLLEDIDLPLAVEICTEACSARLGVADAKGMLESADRAAALARGLSNGDLRDLVMLTRGWVLCYVGRSDEGRPLLEQAVGTAECAKLDPLGLMRISGALEWLDRSRDAYEYALRDVGQARAAGAVGLLPYLPYQQAWHPPPSGPLNTGLAPASEALELARDLDLWLPRVQSLLVLTAITG